MTAANGIVWHGATAGFTPDARRRVVILTNTAVNVAVPSKLRIGTCPD